MRQAVLLGKPDTKRTDYLGRAAREAGLHVLFLDWDRWRQEFPEGKVFLKIDPPVWDSCRLEQLEGLVEDYRKQLEEIKELARYRDVEFLNEPGAIWALLDKERCKERLMDAGVAVTEPVVPKPMPPRNAGTALWESYEKMEIPADQPEAESKQKRNFRRIENGEQLLAAMEARRIYQVFIKPVWGSGAAGVAAFRWQPRRGQMVLYTCAREQGRQEHRNLEEGLGKILEGSRKREPEEALDNGLVNTKRLRRLTDPREILSLVDRLLHLGCIVERWYAKAKVQGFSYDLRAVMQEGRMDFCLARLSQGPITNLHLNNHPLRLEELGLPGRVTEEIETLCKRAMECFPGLRSAGIDILLERESLKPRVIEMNAQGDLIYQDIYGENVIYRRQAEMMKRARQEGI